MHMRVYIYIYIYIYVYTYTYVGIYIVLVDQLIVIIYTTYLFFVLVLTNTTVVHSGTSSPTDSTALPSMNTASSETAGEPILCLCRRVGTTPCSYWYHPLLA